MAAGGAVAEPLTEAGVDAVVEATFPPPVRDLTDPGRTEAAAATATAACCWFKGKMKAGPC